MLARPPYCYCRSCVQVAAFVAVATITVAVTDILPVLCWCRRCCGSRVCWVLCMWPPNNLTSRCRCSLHSSHGQCGLWGLLQLLSQVRWLLVVVQEQHAMTHHTQNVVEATQVLFAVSGKL